MLVKGYIIDVTDTGKSISFDYFKPLNEDIAAEYEDASVRGRSEPHSFYAQTSADTFQFEIQLVASTNEGDSGSPKDIYDDYLFLKSFQYPDYGDNYTGPVRPPRLAKIVIGNFFRKKGQIRSPGFTFNMPLDEEGYSYVIDVRFSFRVVNDIPLDFRRVRQGKVNIA